MADDAVRHAVAAGEMTWATWLIEQHFDEQIYLRGEGATVQRWLSALPGDLARTRPRLLLAQAYLASVSGRMEMVEPLLDAAEQAYAGAARESFEPTVGRAGSMLVNVPALIAIRRAFLAALRGDAENTAAFASRALAETEEGEWLPGSTTRGFLAMAEWLRGRLAEAGLCPGLRRRRTADGFPVRTADRGPAGRAGGHRSPAGLPGPAAARLDVGHTGPGSRSGTAPVAVPGLVKQLTSRELEVLGMLAAGQSNQAIAGQLVVTLDTVKKHVSHLLGKLGAANRTGAVTRARELGLIP